MQLGRRCIKDRAFRGAAKFPQDDARIELRREHHVLAAGEAAEGGDATLVALTTVLEQLLALDTLLLSDNNITDAGFTPTHAAMGSRTSLRSEGRAKSTRE